MTSKSAVLLALVVAMTTLFVGCKGGSIKTEMVTGKITLDGEPVADAKIVFSPVGSGESASGVSDAEGVYTLTTNGGAPGKGALVGEYQVGIVKQENVAPQPTKEELEAASAAGEDISRKYPAEMKDIIPTKYVIPARSGLTASVKAGKNEIDFQLDSN
ncbi:MAG: carboxypeptidase-like regulatory domain-containing protein [Planctomycetia bacterium]|nr:carboxypeptidase-like regulatory domain-containing protein [Planctomycetia bacterium]